MSLCVVLLIYYNTLYNKNRKSQKVYIIYPKIQTQQNIDVLIERGTEDPQSSSYVRAKANRMKYEDEFV